jgi:plastocyanin
MGLLAVANANHYHPHPNLETNMRMTFALATFAGLSCAAQAAELSVTIKDHKFHPATIEAAAGEKHTLTVINEDASAEEFESHDLKREKIVKGKSRIKVMIGPLKPGSYNFFGEFNPKTAQGTLVIK